MKHKHQETWETLVTEFVATKEARKDKQTTAWYRTRLRHFTRFAAGRRLKPKGVRTADLDVFFGEQKAAGYKYKTRLGTLTALKAFFKWLVRRRLIKRDPFAEFEPLPKERDVIEPISLSHAYKMIKAAEAEGSLDGKRDAAMMRLLLTTGARRIEVVRLTLEDVSLLDGGLIKLWGKFDHRRWAFLKPTTLAALREWLAVRPETESQALFVSLGPYGRGPYETLQPGAVNDLLVKWRERARLPRASVSPHKWRHRFATELARAKDPFALKDLMGHSDLATTDGYVHSHPDVLRDLVLKYAPDVPL